MRSQGPLTVEDLDMLGKYSVVLDRDGDAWIKGRNEEWIMLSNDMDGYNDSDYLHAYHPITLHESGPGAAPPTPDSDLLILVKKVSSAFWSRPDHQVTPELLDAMLTLRAELSTLEDQ